MWTNIRIAGGVVFMIALFLRPMKPHGSDSAFQLAAYWNNVEAIAVFMGSMALGVTATISTLFTKRVVDWLENLLTLVAGAGVVAFVWRFGDVHDGVHLSWPGLMIVGGLLMIALGAHGRYRHRLRAE